MVASKGKSTIDVEVDTSALNALVALAEKYRDVLKESNDLLKSNVDITKQASGAQERLNRVAGEGTRTRRERRKREETEEDLFPEGKRYRNYTGTFTKRPVWQQPGETGPSGRFSAGWEKPPGNLSDMDRLRWGPGRNNTGSGQFTGGWAKAPKGPLSDMDRLPWGKGTDSTGSGQFKAQWTSLGKNFEKFDKSNQKWNEQFYQMFATGRLGQNILRSMFSGNLLKMLGVGGIVAAAGYAVGEGARTGAEQRRQALGVGGDIGKMKSAQVELARFGPVDPGLQAARRAQTGIGPEWQAYLQMGFTPDQIKKGDPSDLYAQMLLKAQTWAKKNKNNPAMANIAEGIGLPGVLGGGMTTLNTLQGTSTEEAQQAADAIAANAKYLESSQEQLKALTNLTTTLNLASSEIQTHFINKLADIAPAIDNFIKNQMNKINEGPEAAPSLKPGGIFNPDNWGWGGPILGGKTTPETVAPPQGPRPDGKLRPVPHLHSPLNNPPLESNIQGGGGAVEEGDGNVLGGVTRVSIFSPKIAKLNKDVTDTSKSLAEFNAQLLRGSQIMVGGSGKYLASNFGGGGVGDGAGGGGVGGGGGDGKSSGSTGILGVGGTTGASGVVGGTGVGDSSVRSSGARPAKGALKGNQAEAYKAAIDSGLSDSSARALVANMSGEALSDPGNVHFDRTHTARGIVQWDPERSEAIKKQFGKYPNEMSVAEQTKAAIWEMKTNPKYKDTWNSLQGGGSVESKIGTLVTNYERPLDKAGAISTRIGFAKGLPVDMSTGGAKGDGKAITGSGGSSGGGGASGSWGGAPEANFGIKDSEGVLDHLKSARDKGLITNEQCVSLATASVGIKLGSKTKGAWTSDWRKGESAEEGNLVKGTPVATFAGLHGEQNQDIYAGGTGGRAKVGLDHAAVFESYIKDKNGKIIGMNVADQWKGSQGIQNQHPYYFGGGRGEHDARNYSAIDVAGGGHLGGENNPLTQRDAARDAPIRTASRSGPHPHIGDMSQYHTNQAIKVNVNNPAGADVIAQTSMLGSAQGNFG